MSKQKNRKQAQNVIKPNQDEDGINLFEEVDYIIACAMKKKALIAKLDDLILFSTVQQDAWLLDPVDNYAINLVFRGERKPFEIKDSETGYKICWSSDYRIEGDDFIVTQKVVQETAYQGYPIDVLQNVINAS